MKKGIIILILIFIFFPVFGESSLSEKQKEIVINEIKKSTSLEESTFLESYKGNFTGSENNEFLIFLGTIYKDKKRQPSIRRTIVAIFSEEEELISIINVPYNTLLFKGCYESGNLGYGISQGWINDFNDNGLEELLFTEASGSYMLWEIFEFHNGKFIKTFGPDATLTMKECNPQKKELSVIHHLYSDVKGYYKDIEEHFIWNPMENCYMEEAGLEK